MTLSLFLPVQTYPTPTPVEGMTAAVTLAATLSGRLTLTAHMVDIAPINNPLAAGFYDYSSVATTIEADSKAKAGELMQLGKRLAGQLQLPFVMSSFHSRPELASEDFASVARHYDFTLAVLERESAAHRDAAEALLFGSGGPVVLVPGAGVPARLERVAIAWDGGRAAARAVRDALPILRMVRHAIILTAGDDKAVVPESTAAIADLLDAHEISVTRREVHSRGRTVGDALQETALEDNAAMLVMGAYGHNRLREFVLGGATRSVLADLKLPVLMSH